MAQPMDKHACQATQKEVADLPNLWHFHSRDIMTLLHPDPNQIKALNRVDEWNTQCKKYGFPEVTWDGAYDK